MNLLKHEHRASSIFSLIFCKIQINIYFVLKLNLFEFPFSTSPVNMTERSSHHSVLVCQHSLTSSSPMNTSCLLKQLIVSQDSAGRSSKLFLVRYFITVGVHTSPLSCPHFILEKHILECVDYTKTYTKIHTSAIMFLLF